MVDKESDEVAQTSHECDAITGKMNGFQNGVDPECTATWKSVETNWKVFDRLRDVLLTRAIRGDDEWISADAVRRYVDNVA